jgi:hypothetical protein
MLFVSSTDSLQTSAERRASPNVYSIENAVADLESEDVNVDGPVDSAASDLDGAVSGIQGAISPETSNTLGVVAEKTASLAAVLASADRAADALPDSIAGISGELSQRISAQATRRSQRSQDIQSQLSDAGQSASNSFSAAESSRDAIKQSIATKRQVQLSAAEKSVQAAVATDVSRAALDAPSLSTAVAAASTAVAGVQSSTLASESARANQNCTDKLAAVISSQPVPSAASGKDYTTWFVSIMLDVTWSHFWQHVLRDRNSLLLLDEQAYLCMLYVSSSGVRLVTHDSQLARSGKHSTMVHSPTPLFSLCSSKSCCME